MKPPLPMAGTRYLIITVVGGHLVGQTVRFMLMAHLLVLAHSTGVLELKTPQVLTHGVRGVLGI